MTIGFKDAKKYILNRLEDELNPNLLYHGIHHTYDVYEVSIKIAELEGLSQDEKVLINTAIFSSLNILDWIFGHLIAITGKLPVNVIVSKNIAIHKPFSIFVNFLFLIQNNKGMPTKGAITAIKYGKHFLT